MSSLSDTLDALPKPVLLVDPDARTVVDSNTGAQEWFGLSRRKLSSADASTLFGSVDNAPTLLRRVLSENVSVELTDVTFEEQSANLLFFPHGEHVGVLVMPDRATAVRGQKGRPIHSLGQMIGHELKNPLAGIKGAAQLLRHDVRDPESLSLLDLISSEIDRIRRLADRLQTFGDTDGALARVNVHTVMRNARKIIAPSADAVLFSEDYDPSLPHIEGDTDMLMQVLINLLKNAVEALGEGGGEITLRTRSRSGVKRDAHQLPIEMQVIDNGAGLPADMLDRVFEPFVTTKPSGQGLGLALVAKVVEDHGGIVEVKSRPGKTVFSILLPAASQEPPHAV